MQARKMGVRALLPWVFVTDAAQEPEPDNINYNIECLTEYYGFKYLRWSEAEVTLETVLQWMWEYEGGEYEGFVFYIEEGVLIAEGEDLAEWTETVTQAYGKMLLFASGDEGWIAPLGCYAAASDTYHLGYAAGTAYADGEDVPQDQLRNLYESLGYFPVIAPERYKNDVCFLTGMSTALGFPVTVVSTVAELACVTEDCASRYGLFEHWLLIGICEETYNAADETTGSMADVFAGYGISQDNLRFFVSAAQYAAGGFTAETKNVYVYEDAEMQGKVIYALCGHSTQNLASGYEEWVYTCEAAWTDEEYPTDEIREEWFSYWRDAGYEIDDEVWNAYRERHLNPDYAWNTFWETPGTFAIAQSLSFMSA